MRSAEEGMVVDTGVVDTEAGAKGGMAEVMTEVTAGDTAAQALG